jgi:D-sedoheptulose 7-phosphate isomerase
VQIFGNYLDGLLAAQQSMPLPTILSLAETLRVAWVEQRQVFICGNGGSAANSLHIANDLFYGIGKEGNLPGIRIHALSANQPILTCLANDVSYADIFSQQLKAYANAGDILIVLSGSGNSPNIVKAVETAKERGLSTWAILGYSGGECLHLAESVIHIPVNDMQIAEDLQLIIGHMVMQWLRDNPPHEVVSR